MNETPQVFTEEQLIEADRARLRRQQEDPYRERHAWEIMHLENQRRQQHSGAKQ